MIVYRIGKTKWSGLLDGEGSRINGGRWNHIGTPCIYTSESRALAILEYTVNTNIDDIPRSLSLTTIEIPEDIKIYKIAELPGDWLDVPAPGSTKDFGTNFLKEKTHSVLCFPSSILPLEFNYILNPLHPKSNYFKIFDIQDFVYDLRIKTV
jgi:RES domain-containing protein